MSRALALMCALTAFVGAGCATQVTKELPVIDADKVRVRLESEAQSRTLTEREDDSVEISGVWRRSLEPFERQEQIVPVALSTPKPVEPPVPVRKQTALDRLIARSNTAKAPRKHVATPKPRRRKPVRAEGKQAVKSAAKLARDHYIDYPTKIVAQRITFYIPAELVPELRHKAEDVREVSSTRRLLRGKARAVCRELTLEADRITIRIREEAGADLQITALGDATLVSTVRKQTTREEGLKSMLITNDKLVPLR